MSLSSAHQGNPSAEERTALSVRLFGSFEVQIDGQAMPRLRSRKGQWLLALLTLRAGRPIERAWLAGTVWPETTEEHSLVSLRQTLADLRQALGREGARIASPTSRTLAFDTSHAFVDVLAFDQAIRQGDPESLKRAIALLDRPLLEDCLEEWILPEREVRQRASLTARQVLASAAMTQGDPAVAVSHLRSIIAADPYQEAVWRDLMTALAQSGDWGAAVGAYRELRLLFQRELQTEPSSETRELHQTLRAEARQRADCKDRSAPEPRLNKPKAITSGVLPRMLTDLIGREHETAIVSDLLQKSRLVTLTGPGGVGKTRLAIRVGEEWAEEQPEGAWFVDLASLNDPALVPSSVAAIFGTRGEPKCPQIETLVDALRDRHLLLILDNCEHVLDACVALTAVLLAECPFVRLITTSRQALRMTGETVWTVPSLAMPHLQEEHLLETLSKTDSVRLFIERAASIQPGFALTATNAQSVAQICRRLDGIPLALELAAARTRILSPEQIAARLDDQFQLLTQGSRTALPRHQTLRATVDWSYALLTPSEQRLLAWLSVFSGGWTLEAAEAVCSDLGEDVLDLLTELEAKSIVLVDSGNGSERRYRLLETVRQYARERLIESDQAADASKRHREWALALAETAENYWRGAESGIWMTRLQADHDNLRAALESCERSEDDALTGLQIAAAMWLFWMDHGHYREGMERLQRALAQAGNSASETLRSKSLNGTAAMALNLGELALARSCMEEALILARRSGNIAYLDNCIHNLGNVCYYQNEYAAARALWEESLAMRREAEYLGWVEASLNNLGFLAYNEDDVDRAETLHTEALSLAMEQNNIHSRQVSHIGLGNVAYMRGDLPRARSYYEQALVLAQDEEDIDSISDIFMEIGWVALADGNGEEAWIKFQTGLEIACKAGLTPLILNALDGFSELALANGDSYRAACIYSAVEARRKSLLLPRMLAAHRRSEAHHLRLRASLTEDDLDAAWNKGYVFTLDQAIAYSLTSPCPPAQNAV